MLLRNKKKEKSEKQKKRRILYRYPQLKEKRELGLLGEDIGLLFQLADDFLDVKGKSKYTGKKVNKYKKKGKSSIINLVGYNYAYDYAINLKKRY